MSLEDDKNVWSDKLRVDAMKLPTLMYPVGPTTMPFGLIKKTEPPLTDPLAPTYDSRSPFNCDKLKPTTRFRTAELAPAEPVNLKTVDSAAPMLKLFQFDQVFPETYRVSVLPLPEILAEPAATSPPKGLAEAGGAADEPMRRASMTNGLPQRFTKNCKFIALRFF